MSDRPCHTPGCTGIGYHPASHPHPLKWCLECLVKAKRDRRHGAKSQRELNLERVPDDKGYQPRGQELLGALKNPGFGL
jgi:hypothetical protein